MSSSRPDKPLTTENSTSSIHSKLSSLASASLQSKMLPNGLSGITSALTVISTTHWMDTSRRRVQITKEPLKGATISETLANYQRVILRQSYAQGPLAQIKDLNLGLVKAMKYKSGQLPYRWMAYNGIRDNIVNPYFAPLLDPNAKSSKVLMSGLAGALTGAGEALTLIKWDSEKIASQTVRAGESANISLLQAYKPIWVTMMRNCPGSFAVFGVEALISELIFKGKKKDEVGKLQQIGAFMIGGVAGVALPMPADTVKTIMQSEKSARSATAIAIDLYKSGGIKPFYQSLGLSTVLTGARAGLGLGLAKVIGPFFSQQCKGLNDKFNGPKEKDQPQPKFG